MDNLDLTPREWVAAGLLGLLALGGIINGEPGMAVLMGILGAIYMYRQTESGRENDLENRDNWRREREYQRRDGDYMHRREMAQRARPANVDHIREHALDAVRRAGLNPDNVQVLPVDIGLLTFRGDESPVIHRTQPVLDDVDYVQPYVQLRVPVTATGIIKFEIFDDSGQKVYGHEDHYDLKRGRNLITPTTRLPVHDERAMDGRWQVQISGDGVRLATYQFRWEDSQDAEFRKHVRHDGEISSELQAFLDDSQVGQMSLDDLLGSQDDEANQQYM